MEHTNHSVRLAEILLQIGAIKINLQKPYTWASGWDSPIYCDNRKILYHPELREEIAEMMAAGINKLYPGRHIVLAGVATGAIGIGILVAAILKRPFVYVRPKPKDHGTGSQIECAELNDTHEVVIIEDLVSTGNSSLNIVDVVNETGAKVLGMGALFTYGFPKAIEAFKRAGVSLHTLSDYNTLIEVAGQKNLFETGQKLVLDDWRQDPENWKPQSAS